MIARFPSSFFAIGKIDTCRQWSIQFLIIIIYLLFTELSSRNHCQHMCFSRKLKHMWAKTLLLHLDLASLSKRGTHTRARASFYCLLSFIPHGIFLTATRACLIYHQIQCRAYTDICIHWKMAKRICNKIDWLTKWHLFLFSLLW
jgi:hypothetical protein